jgi:glycosyltransferase involved in cell wall biosynthesis
VAMGYGLPIVMSDVGGNSEAAQGYKGILLIPPGQPESLLDAVLRVPELMGTRYAHPSTWEQTVTAYELLFDSVADA